MLKICILDAKTLGSDLDLSVFNQLGQVTEFQMTRPEEIVERIKEQDVVISNKVVLNETSLQFAQSLKLVCIAATGTNNIDLEYAKSRGIAVTNVAGYSTDSVAQHTFAMLFHLLEHIAYYDQYVKSKAYAQSDIFTHLGRPYDELMGKTWGIIGLGAIGRSVAGVAKAFGCKVVYYSTSGKNNSDEYRRVELDELLRISDIISIHAPLNPQTKDMITYKELSSMRRNSILLNLGRGGIVNEEDLARALDDELLAGAALDVLVNEPIKEDNSLLKVKNSNRLLITPHIAWASTAARKRLVNEIYLNIEAFVRGDSKNRVC